LSDSRRPCSSVESCGVLRRAERRHFEDVGADVDVHEAEAAADDVRAPEQRLHLFGRRIGGDVEVLRREAEHEVAHRAADHERLEAASCSFSTTVRALRATCSRLTG
jgi:hypothetical protein